jgi:transposase
MGAPIHPEIKRAAVRLNQFFSTQMASYFLGVSEDSVRRAVKLFEETGDVVNPGTGKKRGRKPLLNEGEREVSDV